VLVLRERKPAGKMADGPALTPEQVMRMMAGAHE
jgi:hypothetical protein